MPGNGPLVFSESFNEDFSSAMGLSSIGKSVAGLSTAPLLCKLTDISSLSFRNINNVYFSSVNQISKCETFSICPRGYLHHPNGRVDHLCYSVRQIKKDQGVKHLRRQNLIDLKIEFLLF